MRINWRGLFNRNNGIPGVKPGTSLKTETSSADLPFLLDIRSEKPQSEKPKRKYNLLIIVPAFLAIAVGFGALTYFFLNQANGTPAAFYKVAGHPIASPNPAVAPVPAPATPEIANASVMTASTTVKTIDKPQSPPVPAPVAQGGNMASLDIKTQNPFKAEFLKKINSAKNISDALPAFKGPMGQLPLPPLVQLPPPPPKKMPLITVYGIANFDGEKYAFTSAGKILEKDKIGDAEVIEIKENGIQFDTGFLPLSKSASTGMGGKR